MRKWRGRYAVKAAFMARMDGLIARQVEAYEKSPEEFVHMLPLHLHMLNTTKTPSDLIHYAVGYAQCLIAVGRIPTVEYMWHLMAVDPSDAPAYTMDTGQKIEWQPHLSPGLMTPDEYRKTKKEPPHTP
jgi:hypothetical protein